MSQKSFYGYHYFLRTNCEEAQKMSILTAILQKSLGGIGWCVFSLIVITANFTAAVSSARAQDSLSGGSYITPFPSGDVYQLRVIGDSLAEGLHGIIRDSLSVDARINVNRQRWVFNSLLSSRFSRKLRALKQDLKNDHVNIAVVMIGTWDRRSVEDQSGRRQRVGSPGWREVLSRRVDAMMRTLKDLKLAVYWVGLPPLRNGKANAVAQVINEVIRERAYLRGLKYIDVFTSFADDTGAYSAYGPDLTGKIRLLRERDGINFKFQGNRKLAHFVERELKRDLKQAKADRSIPLAGSPREQARVAQKRKNKNARGTQKGWRASIRSDVKPETAKPAGSSGGFFSGASGGEQKADNGSIKLRTFDKTGREETVTMELERPAISASVVALVTRKQSTDRLSQIGDTVVDQIAGGYSIMSSVTPVHEALGGAARSRLSPAQTPFFRVLIKGERTVPKPGRADDFSWPRPPPPPLPEPVKLVPRRKGGADVDDGGMPLPVRSPFRRKA